MSGEEDGFLGRWSRRKRAREQSEAVPQPEPLQETPPAPEPALSPDDEPPLTDEELAALPRIEDLVEGSDIKAFLRAGVPRALRSAALRRVWMLTPAIRDYKNPAVDYAWDWNTPGGVPGDGCAPSPERAAQMLRDLFTPRVPAETAEPPVAAPEPVGMADAEDAPPGDADSETLHVSENPEGFPDGQKPEATEHAVAPRRHGGAMPS